jgi:hypothetical protein
MNFCGSTYFEAARRQLYADLVVRLVTGMDKRNQFAD